MARTKKKTTQEKYDLLKKHVAEYIAKVDARRGVVHSTTPQTDGDKSVGISIAELITISETVKTVGKHVTLEVAGKANLPKEKTLSLVVVDSYPAIPPQLRHPDLYNQ